MTNSDAGARLDRRDFLRRSGAAVAAAAVLPLTGWATDASTSEARERTASPATPASDRPHGRRQREDVWRTSSTDWRSGCGNDVCRVTPRGVELITPFDTPARWSPTDMKRGRGRDAIIGAFGETVYRQVLAAVCAAAPVG